MLGVRSPQGGLFEADHLYLESVGADTFYGFLARGRGEIFRDQDFAMLYCLAICFQRGPSRIAPQFEQGAPVA